MKDKNFDAVKMMRQIRDKISAEISEMSYKEQRERLDKVLAKSEHNYAKGFAN